MAKDGLLTCADCFAAGKNALLTQGTKFSELCNNAINQTFLLKIVFKNCILFDACLQLGIPSHKMDYSNRSDLATILVPSETALK